MKTFDQKIANIRANPAGAKDFILADAKDADMAGGMSSIGADRKTGKPRTIEQYREQMRIITRQGLVDIMLMSCSSSEVLTINERLFENSPVTPAARANDTTDIHLPRGGTYSSVPSRPFASATIDHIQAGKSDPAPHERKLGANLGLYSITPNNQLEFDYPTLLAFKEFRAEAERKGFRYFLEVFDPNACGDNCPADLAQYINDMITRILAGVPSAGRPQFLKIAYHGPEAMERLASFDPTVIVGILGGSSGTTFDAFHQLWEAKKHGARAALYGRMINHSEDQPTFVQHLRWLADGVITEPAEAVKSYHAALQKLSILPIRPLADDLQHTRRASAYGGRTSVVVAGKPGEIQEADFSKMTTAQKVEWNRKKWAKILG
jgi:hypothetical protein